MKRRDFLIKTTITGVGISFYSCQNVKSEEIEGLVLKPTSLVGNLSKEEGKTPLPNATWYSGEKPGDGLIYKFEPGQLAEYQTLTCDMLLDDVYMTAFRIHLQEGADGPEFTLNFKLLNECGARIRMATSEVNQNHWKLEREGAWLKPIVGGDRVDLEKVDRMRLVIYRDGGKPTRFCLTDMIATNQEVPKILHPVLPEGKLLDEIGQSTIHQWPERTKNLEELKARLKKQLQESDQQKWPAAYNRWGGWKNKKFEGSGYFNKIHDGERWWLVDPTGHAFWSAGLDSVRVDTSANYQQLEDTLSWNPEKQPEFKEIYSRDHTHINYLAANFIRTFGSDWYEQWSEITLGHLRDFGFNTVANWSDWEIARAAGVPYVRPLSFSLPTTSRIYRSFPDVYHPNYEADAKEYATQLKSTLDDPALIGYFLMNEPDWGFSSELPAVGMLYNTPECATRTALAEYLQQKYPDQESLQKAWNTNATFTEIERGPWNSDFNATALKDLEEFSEMMVNRFFGVLTEACRKVDPHHMNLGARYHTVPPLWAQRGMKQFDVFSMNCYREKVPLEDTKEINELLGLPVMIGEFHFGALDVGLPATGIGHVKNQEARGEAYRVYVEDAAANPYCIGTHYFILYDQSALGRFDGENYNIGFLDICNRPYQPLAAAARLTHERLYEVASGSEKPFDQAPQYFPKLF